MKKGPNATESVHLMGSTAVILMAKAPQPGTVKTRLCPPLSPAEAAELSRCFLLDALERLRALEGVAPVLAYTPANGRAFFAEVAPDFALQPQPEGDLGQRMAGCLEQLVAQGYTDLVLTGSDLPTLPTAYLQQAVDLLSNSRLDVVLGPSEDGGYYLIGMHHVYRELFRDMPWSTDQVFAKTLQRARDKGLQVACVPPWFDVDTAADLNRLHAALRQTPADVAPNTRQFFLTHYDRKI